MTSNGLVADVPSAVWAFHFTSWHPLRLCAEPVGTPGTVAELVPARPLARSRRIRRQTQVRRILGREPDASRLHNTLGSIEGHRTPNTDQLFHLRNEFAPIQSVSPDRLSDFHRIFDGCSDVALVQLAKAGIKFVSRLAVNACSRRGVALV